MPQQWFSIADRFGRVTIPAELRRRFRLRPGTKLMLTRRHGYIFVQTLKAWREQHPGVKPDRS